MNELMKFDFQFQDNDKNVHVDQAIRVIEINGEPWFVGVDVCEVLELSSNTSQAYKRLKDYEKQTYTLYMSGQNRDVTLISESGLYRLVLTSRKPQAEPFQDWVCQEVIPQIRKTGQYQLDGWYIPDDYPSALRLAADECEKRLAAEKEVRRTKSQLDDAENTLAVYRSIMSPDVCLDLKQVADGLAVPRMGRNNLFRYLRGKRFIVQNDVVPYHDRIEDELAVVENTSVEIRGQLKTKQKTKVTFKGLERIVKWLEEDGYRVDKTPKQVWDKYNTDRELESEFSAELERRED
jgi:prophage antirepressor-like protein